MENATGMQLNSLEALRRSILPSQFCQVETYTFYFEEKSTNETFRLTLNSLCFFAAFRVYERYQCIIKTQYLSNCSGYIGLLVLIRAKTSHTLSVGEIINHSTYICDNFMAVMHFSRANTINRAKIWIVITM